MSCRRRREELEVMELSGSAETLLFDIETGVVVSLNPTAAAVWYLCDGKRDIPAIASELRAVFGDEDPQKIQTDVEAIVGSLAERELLV